MRNPKRSHRTLRRVMAFASGAILLQAGTCAVDTNALLTDIVNLTINALLSGL